MEVTTARSFCRFCEALCGVIVTVDEGRIESVRGDPDDPLSRGYTCPKGRALGAWHHRADRLDDPHLGRAADRRVVDWEECLGDLADRLQQLIAQHGRDAVGFYIATGVAFDANGRRTGERLQRAMGTKSKYTATTIDTPAKLLVSELMAGWPGLVPAPDRRDGTLFVFLGTNPVVSHGHLNAFPDPVVTLREMSSRGEVWVIDPRRTETARLAERHLRIRPGTDYAVLAYAVRAVLADGADHAYLADHAEGVDRLERAVAPFDVELATQLTGLSPAELDGFVAAVRRHGRFAGQSGTGVTMSAAANVSEWLLWALHIVTGSFDRPGGSWFHPGFLRRFDARPMAPTDGRPGPGPDSRPDIPGRWGEIPCSAMADEIEAGNLRALLVLGGNPITSFPDATRTRAALAQLDVLAVADVVATDTTDLATHVLPVAGQLERADMPLFIDQFMPTVSTRYTPAVVPPGARRRPLWWVLADLGRRLGYDVLPGELDPDEATDDDLLAVIADRSRGTFAEIRERRVLEDAPAVFGWVHDHVLPHGRWRLAPQELVDQLRTMEPPAPLALVPRRQLRHLNSQLRDEGAGGRRDRPEVVISPGDASDRAIVDGAEVTVRSAHGSVEAVVRIDPDAGPGVASIPHGFARPNVSRLTTARRDVDPLTGMVLQSGVPVEVEPR